MTEAAKPRAARIEGARRRGGGHRDSRRVEVEVEAFELGAEPGGIDLPLRRRGSSSDTPGGMPVHTTEPCAEGDEAE